MTDRSRIDANDEEACRYWCNEFGCEPAHLKAAVSDVGDSPEAVRRRVKDLMNARVDTTG